MDCREYILSEDVGDYIVPSGRSERLEGGCSIRVPPFYDIGYFPFDEALMLGGSSIRIGKDLESVLFGYYTVPKLFAIMDGPAEPAFESRAYQTLESAGILKVVNQPILNLDGSGILVGFVDTGIDYESSMFRNRDGSSRILAIWDQTDQSGVEPENLYFGSEYTKKEIDEALRQTDPKAVVPHEDTDGHGTYLASVAVGGMVEGPGGVLFGVAQNASIAVVKCKPAKKYLRDYFGISEGVTAYQENDLMLGILYLEEIAVKNNLPLVICMAMGSSAGGHEGALPLTRSLSVAGARIGTMAVAAMGNENSRQHHFQGRIFQQGGTEEVELRVAAGQTQLYLELWALEPEVYSILIQSPSGESTRQIEPRPGRIERIDFVLENTQVEVVYRIVVQESGGFLITIRLKNPSAGIWKIRVYNNLFITGVYHLWLPVSTLIQPGTGFLQPNPDVTLTAPADTQGVLAVSAYDIADNSIYLYSGRGNMTNNLSRPDLAAPGVDVTGLGRSLVPGEIRFANRSGTGAAAAITAGASALLSQWVLLNQARFELTTDDGRTYLIRGARRREDGSYPNKSFGYGSLDLYQTFLKISDPS